MLTVMVAFRNTKSLAINCLSSLVETFRLLGNAQQVEFLFTDDASEPDAGLVPLFGEFRKSMASPVKVIQFKERQHYTRVCAHGFSQARGDMLLFLSHDMMLTPSCLNTMLSVAALDTRIGLVRATSPYVDCFPQHQVPPPFPLRHLRDIFQFAQFVADYHGVEFVEDALLTGDVMLIKRSLLERIGVMDPRYFGYFGDIDFGLRAQRAGFALVCAKGAWLYHVGAGYYKDEADRTQRDRQTVHRARMEVVDAAYRLFREKWDPSMPPSYTAVANIDFPKLRNLPAVGFELYEPPLTLTPEIGTVLSGNF